MDLIGKKIAVRKIKDLQPNQPFKFLDVGDEAFGTAHMNPTINERFDINGDNGISTSPVQSIDESLMRFTTLNSIYQVFISGE